MPNIIASAAPQHIASSRPAAFNHLAPVVDLLRRSANAKFQQGAGARRWPMVATLVRRAFAGAKTLLAVIGAVAVGGLLLLPLQREGMQRLPLLGTEGLFVPSTEVAGPIQARAETPTEREQRAVTEFIAKRYRVSEGAVAGYVEIGRAHAELQSHSDLVCRLLLEKKKKKKKK